MKSSVERIIIALVPLTLVCGVLCALVAVCDLAWIMAIILPIYLFAVFCAILLNDDSLRVEVGATDGSYKKVMSNIEGITQANPKYIDIAVLGSHDAVTDKLEQYSPLDPHNAKNKLLVFAYKLIRGFAYRFGRTQTVGIYDQIAAGSRFLHIKCTYLDGEWYCSHGRLCGKLDAHLAEALRYLTSEDADGEIIGFLFQTMHMPSGVTLDDLMAHVDSVKLNGKSVFDFVRVPRADIFNNGDGGVKVGDLTYNDLTLNGTAPGAVIFVRRETGLFRPEWEGDGELVHKCYDMDTCADHTWHSAIGRKKLLAKVHANGKRIAQDQDSKTKLRMNQSQACFTVSDAKEFFITLFAWSLLRFAKTYNNELISSPYFDEWLTRMPVFQVDYVNSNYMDFNSRVNALIRTHNENTVRKLLGKQ